MRFSITTFLFTLLSLLATLSVAAPVLEKRDVFVPPIIAPGEGAVWQKGSTQTVVWDVSNPPAQITNNGGLIVLRSVAQGLLLLDIPLASGFPILDGHHDVIVPTSSDVPAGKYQIVVFGDSGNWGPEFDIID